MRELRASRRTASASTSRLTYLSSGIKPGQPHKGKVLAAIQPHSDDLPLFAAGTIIKLIREGYTGILIRTTNDEMAGSGATIGEVILNNEKDNAAIARRWG